MSAKEATARIKINHLLEEAGWRFFDDQNGAANICLEPKVNRRGQSPGSVLLAGASRRGLAGVSPSPGSASPGSVLENEQSNLAGAGVAP